MDGYRYPWLWHGLGWLLVAALTTLSLIHAPTQMAEIRFGDKIGHISAYTLLMLWFAQLYQGRARIAYALGFISMGVGLEYLQGMTGYRSFDVFDMLANSLGVLLGLTLAQSKLGRGLWFLEKRLP